MVSRRIWTPTEYDDWRWAGSGVNPAGAPAAATLTEVQTADFSAALTGVNRKISSCLTATLKLALSSGTGCALLGLDAHYQKDRLGSAQVTSKT